ncbi:hypothetical protein NXC12_PD00013 (plasmid) [Rhizobium etli]|uniref:Uncharacterized protein n=1 Tax=Rhizobium etli TaxID=29449 RepID=A0AAN1BMB3_RHIET|nr:hypothetical protein [Rhizobium etli]ARQ13126.1 hypothetical protein NXC12_PD00013 [Rhizobium etli]
MAEKPAKKKTCFVVSPIGNDGSQERIHADWLLEGIITPVFAAHYANYQIVRADKMPAPGLIDVQIIEQLLDAELVIADITTLNPNVFYEIGVRHVVNKPIIHMVRANDPIPFDIKLFRHIPFSVATPQALESAKAALKEALDATFAEDFKVDNPVTRTRGVVKFEESATPHEKLILDRLETMDGRLSNLEEPQRATSDLLNRLSRGDLPGVNTSYARGAVQFRDNPEIGIRVTAKLQSPRQLHEDSRKVIESHFTSYGLQTESESTAYFTVKHTNENKKNAISVEEIMTSMDYDVEIILPHSIR